MRISMRSRVRRRGVEAMVAAGAMLLVFSMTRPAMAVAASRLADATERQDRAVVRALLQQRVDVNVPQGDGMTALHWAARWDDLEMAGLLLEAGADSMRSTDLGVTPLWLACQNGSWRMVTALLTGGADASAALATGETVLMRAAWTGNVEVVKLLLTHGAGVNARESGHGQTALMWAIAQDYPEVARLLVEHGAEIEARSTTGFTPLLFAARVGDLESARLLLARGVNVNDVVPATERPRPTPPRRTEASGSRSIRATDFGIKTRCQTYDPICTPIAGPDGSALLIAAVRGHTDVAKTLLEWGADPDEDGGMGYTALHWAAGTWATELVGPNGIARGAVAEWDALAGLPREAKLDFIKTLLAHGADPNARLVKAPPRTGRTKERHWGINREGATPFLLAALAGDVRVMRLLVTAGADPRLGTDENTTPLMAAASMGRVPDENPVPEREVLDAVKLALELGNDVNAANVLGNTALHAAATNRMNTVVQFLVEKGAQVNARNEDGQTPLAVAEVRRQFAAPGREEHTTTGDLLRQLGGAK
jgi:ankyrin repeat protein